jgi:transposase
MTGWSRFYGVKVHRLYAFDSNELDRGREMYDVELYRKVRLACHQDGMSAREAALHFGINRRTVTKMLKHSIPPGYQQSIVRPRPKLDLFTAVIDQILQDDAERPKKQRHTASRHRRAFSATRIFERLRDEHGFTGGYTIVADYVREQRQRSQEVFVPLEHPPGHAQADFGEALAIIGGVECKIHFFALSLPHSDACFVKAYPAETIL